MTSNFSYFSELKGCSSWHVTFGDSGKDRILAKGNNVNTNPPQLDNVRYVEGLTTNLISIGQLCDEDYVVNFYKEECIVTDKGNIEVMKGIRQFDNCYNWISNKNSLCNLSKEG